MTTSHRPRVICHMMGSIDGRILTDGWPMSAEGRTQYELVHASYDADGWLCGRVTMQQHFAQGVRSDTEIAREYTGDAPRDDYRAPGDFDSFAFIADSHGRLVWETNDIDVGRDDSAFARLALESVERRADDVLWLRYRVSTMSA